MRMASPIFPVVEGQSSFAIASAFVLTWAKRFTRALRHRRDTARLVVMDDRMLADIGLTQSDLRDAVSEPLWRDPTALLRARALERRLSRHGISLGLPDAPPLAPNGFTQPRTDRPARFVV